MYSESTEVHVQRLKPPSRPITIIFWARSLHLARNRPKCPTDYAPALVQTMAWCLTGDNPLSSYSRWCRFGTRKPFDTWDAMRASVIMMVADALHPGHITMGFLPSTYKTASFQKEAMRTQVALWFLWCEICIEKSHCVWVKKTSEHTSWEKSDSKDNQNEMIGFDCICL